MSEKISIAGLDKGEVLAALYNSAKPQGLGVFHYDPAPMTAEEARSMYASIISADYSDGSAYFDYVKGRVMKVELGGDEFDPWGYDRDNGQGSAQRAIEQHFANMTKETTNE